MNKLKKATQSIKICWRGEMPTPAFASIENYESGSPQGEKEIKRLSWVSIFSIDFLLKLLYNIYVN